jgi:hypothetical protein
MKKSKKLERTGNNISKEYMKPRITKQAMTYRRRGVGRQGELVRVINDAGTG